MINKDVLISSAKEYGFDISVSVAEKFDIYANTLVDWNNKINLTAITEPQDIIDKHFIDSLLLLLAHNVKDDATMIDVGTGAGFPSVPVKLYRDDIKLTLLDSLNKRINFLKELSDCLEIKTNCVHFRAEEAARKDEYREKYDVATARAVAKLPVLCEYCLPFVKVGGYFVALKGSDTSAEVEISKNAIKLLGGQIEKVEEFSLPDGSSRGIVVIKKISQTPTKYPRQSAKISKSPL